MGVTYYIRVYHANSSTPSTPDFTICIKTAPANDVPCGAVSLTPNAAGVTTCSSTVTGDITLASQSFSPCGFSGARDVWYSFVATATSHTVEVNGDASFDAVVQAYTATNCSTAVTAISSTCTDISGSGGIETLQLNNLTVGVTYYVRVYHANTSTTIPSTPTFTICIKTAPANDVPCGATTLTPGSPGGACGTAATGDISLASQSFSPCGFSGARDVWFNFVATATSHTITVDGDASFDAVVQGYTATNCSTAVTAISSTCTDVSGSGGIENLQLTGLNIGTTYYVRVYHANTSTTIPSTPTFTICVSTPPANDNCAGAINLTFGVPVNGTTVGATSSGTTSYCGSGADDVWYSMNVPASGNIRITVTGTGGFDPAVNLRTSTACPGSDIVCYDYSGTNGTETIRMSGLTPSSSVRIRVSRGGSTSGTFTITGANDYTVSGNDNVIGVITASVGNTVGNSNATYGQQLGEPVGLNWLSFDVVNSQWFTFTPTTTGCYNLAATAATPSASFDSQIAIYTTTTPSNFNTYNEVASNEDINANTFGYHVWNGAVTTTLTSGVTYYVQVSMLPYNTGIPTLRILNLAPAVPVATAATVVTCTGFTANWNAAANATAYLLDVSTDPTFATFVTGLSGFNVGNVTSFNVTGLSGLTHYYRVRAVNACGTASTNSNTITIDNTPAQPAAFTASTATVCAPITGVIYTVPNDPTVTYTWAYTGTGATINGTGNSVTVDFAANTTSGTLSVVANKCSGTSAARTIAVTVNTTSVAPTGITGTTTICNGGNTTLTLTGGTQGTGATAEWFAGSCGGTPVGTGNSINVSPTSNTTYFVRYAGTCNTTVCASQLVTVNIPSIAPTGITGTTTICNGGNTTLTLAGGTQGTGATAEWFAGSCGSSVIGTGNSINVSPTSNTTYFVRYAGTCNTTVCASQLVTVNPLAATVTATAGTGATPSQITANWNAAANATSYILEVATDLAFTNIVFNSNVGNVTSFNVTGLTQLTTYHYRVTAVNSCGNAVVSNTISYSTTSAGALTWTGSVSTDWNNPLNWSPNIIPTAGADIIIPNVTNDPVLTTGADGACEDVNISAGATLTINTGKRIDVKGNWTGSNNTITGAGRLVFSGAAAQTLGGGATVSGLQINNTAGVSISNPISITRALELVAGTLSTNGNVTMAAALNANAYIDNFSTGYSGTLTGNVTFQRFSSGTSGFRYLSMPINNPNITEISEVGLTGPNNGQIIPLPSCSNGAIASNSPYGNVMEWREAGPFNLPGCRQSGWWVRSAGTLETGRGYLVRSIQNSTLSVTGTANLNAVTYATPLNLTTTEGNGFHLMGNPYAAPYLWASDITGFGDLNRFNATGAFVGTFTPVVVTSPINDRTIPIFGGFFIRRQGPGAVSFGLPATNRVADATINYFDTESQYTNLHITVNGNGFADQSRVFFIDNDPMATAGYETKYDARKIDGNDDQPAIYTHLLDGTEQLGINGFGELDQQYIIPMVMKPGQDGTFTLNFDNLATFDPTVMVYLEDKQTGNLVDMRLTPSYTFASNVNDNPERFNIRFEPALQATIANQTCDNTGSLTLTQNGGTVWDTYTVADNNNVTYAQGTNFNGTLLINNLTAQEYIVTLTNTNGYTAQQFYTVEGSTPVDVALTANSTNVYANQVVELTATSSNATTYTWNMGDGTQLTGPSTITHTYPIAGTYNVSVTATNGQCSKVAEQTVNVSTPTSVNNAQAGKLTIFGETNRVVITFNNWGTGIANVTLVNAMGQQVKTFTNLNTQQNQHQLVADGIAPGNYFVQVTSGNQTQTQKVVLGVK